MWLKLLVGAICIGGAIYFMLMIFIIYQAYRVMSSNKQAFNDKSYYICPVCSNAEYFVYYQGEHICKICNMITDSKSGKYLGTGSDCLTVVFSQRPESYLN